MPRSVAQKMGVREGSRAFLGHLPAPAQAALELPPLDVSPELVGEFDYLHLFATARTELDELFPACASHLAPRGMLWVSWPKGGRLGTDLALPEVIRIGYSHGLVESTTVSVDATWSGLKFTRPRPGRTYRNSYGCLPHP
jgi:hypothetical protein